MHWPCPRADDRSIVGIGGQIEHEAAVDLEPVERKFHQIAQACVTRAEVVEQNVDTAPLDPLEHVERPRLVEEKDILGHLELEQRWREPGGGEQFANRMREIPE
jgi:hypothetical protein